MTDDTGGMYSLSSAQSARSSRTSRPSRSAGRLHSEDSLENVSSRQDSLSPADVLIKASPNSLKRLSTRDLLRKQLAGTFPDENSTSDTSPSPPVANMAYRDRYADDYSAHDQYEQQSTRSRSTTSPDSKEQKRTLWQSEPRIDVEQAISILQELKKTASPEELVALHRALLPVRAADASSSYRSSGLEDVSAQEPRMRQSAAFPPGLATRSEAHDDILRKRPVTLAPSKSVRSQSRATTVESRAAVVEASQPDSHMTALPRRLLARAITPTQLDDYQAGGYHPGTLHITNGEASPGSSLVSGAGPRAKALLMRERVRMSGQFGGVLERVPSGNGTIEEEQFAPYLAAEPASGSSHLRNTRPISRSSLAETAALRRESIQSEHVDHEAATLSQEYVSDCAIGVTPFSSQQSDGERNSGETHVVNVINHHVHVEHSSHDTSTLQPGAMAKVDSGYSSEISNRGISEGGSDDMQIGDDGILPMPRQKHNMNTARSARPVRESFCDLKDFLSSAPVEPTTRHRNEEAARAKRPSAFSLFKSKSMPRFREDKSGSEVAVHSSPNISTLAVWTETSTDATPAAAKSQRKLQKQIPESLTQQRRAESKRLRQEKMAGWKAAVRHPGGEPNAGFRPHTSSGASAISNNMTGVDAAEFQNAISGTGLSAGERQMTRARTASPSRADNIEQQKKVPGAYHNASNLSVHTDSLHSARSSGLEPSLLSRFDRIRSRSQPRQSRRHAAHMAAMDFMNPSPDSRSEQVVHKRGQSDFDGHGIALKAQPDMSLTDPIVATQDRSSVRSLFRRKKSNMQSEQREAPAQRTSDVAEFISVAYSDLESPQIDAQEASARPKDDLTKRERESSLQMGQVANIPHVPSELQSSLAYRRDTSSSVDRSEKEQSVVDTPVMETSEPSDLDQKLARVKEVLRARREQEAQHAEELKQLSARSNLAMSVSQRTQTSGEQRRSLWRSKDEVRFETVPEEEPEPNQTGAAAEDISAVNDPFWDVHAQKWKTHKAHISASLGLKPLIVVEDEAGFVSPPTSPGLHIDSPVSPPTPSTDPATKYAADYVGLMHRQTNSYDDLYNRPVSPIEEEPSIVDTADAHSYVASSHLDSDSDADDENANADDIDTSSIDVQHHSNHAQYLTATEVWALPQRSAYVQNGSSARQSAVSASSYSSSNFTNESTPVQERGPKMMGGGFGAATRQVSGTASQNTSPRVSQTSRTARAMTPDSAKKRSGGETGAGLSAIPIYMRRVTSEG